MSTTHAPLSESAAGLVSPMGAIYPVVDSLPVLLLDDVEQTIGVACASLDRAKAQISGRMTAQIDIHQETALLYAFLLHEPILPCPLLAFYASPEAAIRSYENAAQVPPMEKTGWFRHES